MMFAYVSLFVVGTLAARMMAKSRHERVRVRAGR
ncbi:hypothetical protein AWB78_01536 [Caballeronia calidae]|uniref:Uncharacterized protein n=1 Tax=Caballeronia calidae TaxID=1777139 RepID=A0A158AE41_9BURK|nr:hypothetical protein AWB78_01536 [Caballeronia calidae]